MRAFKWYPPPWVVYLENRKPAAILPAGRPGEVCDVRGMSAREVSKIVKLANDLHVAVTDARLKGLNRLVKKLAAGQLEGAADSKEK